MSSAVLPWVCRVWLITWTVLLCGSSNSAWLSAEPAEHPHHCMDVAKLRQVIAAAAWSGSVAGVPRSAVVLTTCDLRCLKMLFEPWMWSIKNNRDGDFSKHVIIVGNGHAAYAHCEEMRAQHQHSCVLDQMCLPPRAPDIQDKAMGLGNPLYYVALLQKINWAQEVLKLGLSVMWTDMDIFYLGNPIQFMLNAAPDADMVIQTEYWNSYHIFKGDVCKFAPFSAGCKDKERLSKLNPLCCGMQVNGGLWLVHPTDTGKKLMQMWGATMFKDSIVNGKAWDKTAILDQYFLERILGNQPHSAPLYKWEESQRQYVQYAEVVWDPAALLVYRVSAQRMQSRCFGECGWRGDDVGYRFYTLCRGERKEGLCFGSEALETPDAGTQLVCVMPHRYMERMISIHQNCAADIVYKRVAMMHWMNWTLDEARYEQDAADPANRVVPE